ncbi:MAG: ornithine carbamoyltransferase [Bdellovibrionaceae bacterium]|nr:ornithine carbamoyltransferase [Pseudobdellovibrionaceae bacterium]
MFEIGSMHFLTGEELSQAELIELLEVAEFFRVNREKTREELLTSASPGILSGKTIAMIFEKPSLRTRLSFGVGIHELGGHALELQGNQTKKEDPEDAIRVLQGMVHGVMLRTFEHSNLDRMVSMAKIPVVNGLSDSHHPCQVLADLLTLKQNFGSFQGLRLAYIGDGNNVLHSLLLLAPFLGVDVHYACPNGYLPDSEILRRAKVRATLGKAQIQKFDSPSEAVAGAHAIYTDVWTSMGFEEENALRVKVFADYQVNRELLSLGDPRAVMMHCLPMVKGSEITAEMVEHPRAVLFQQAENRLHAQKALLHGIYSKRV